MLRFGFLVAVFLFLAGCGNDIEAPSSEPKAVPVSAPTEEDKDAGKPAQGSARVAEDLVPPVWEAWVWGLVADLTSPNKRHVALAEIAISQVDGAAAVLAGGLRNESRTAQQARVSKWLRADPKRFLLLRPKTFFSGQGDARSLLPVDVGQQRAAPQVESLTGTWRGVGPKGQIVVDVEFKKDMTFTMKGLGQEQSGTWCVWRGRAWTFTREMGGFGKMAFLVEWTLAGTSLRTAVDGGHIVMTRNGG